MSKPGIVFVFHSSNIQSGATRSMSYIVDYLISKHKYDISVVFPDLEGSAASYYRGKGIPVYAFRYGNLMQDLTQPALKRIVKIPLFCLRYCMMRFDALRATCLFKKMNIQLVYNNTSSIVFGGWLGRYLHAKQIWHIREFRIKDHRITFFLGDRYLKLFIDKCADLIICISQSVKDSHADVINPDKMIVSFNDYSPDIISPKSSFNLDGKLHILIAGDIKPSKGQFETVKAVTKLVKQDYDIVLHLAGKISKREYLNNINKYIKENKVGKNIIFHGQVADMKALRSHMDIGIVASTNEALGRTIAEGMLSQMVMIGRNNGGSLEQIDDNITGLLYDGSVDNLSQKIACLYDDRLMMKKIALCGYRNAIDVYTKDRCSKRVTSEIDKLINCKE